MTWRLHTKLRKIVWHVSTNKSETMNHSNLRIGNIVFVLIAKNILFLWLLSLTVSDFIFCCVTKHYWNAFVSCILIELIMHVIILKNQPICRHGNSSKTTQAKRGLFQNQNVECWCEWNSIPHVTSAIGENLVENTDRLLNEYSTSKDI